MRISQTLPLDQNLYNGCFPSPDENAPEPENEYVPDIEKCTRLKIVTDEKTGKVQMQFIDLNGNIVSKKTLRKKEE